MKNFSLCIFSLIIALQLAVGLPANCESQSFRKSFKHFSADLPPGWDGDEQSGFVSDDKDEYSLTLGKKDENGDSFAAQISVFLLPNKPHADSLTAAETLAQAQGDASQPQLEGDFYVFTGEPRTRTIKGQAKTMVRTTPERMLIIIAQDPQNLGADEILESLRSESAEAREMLGR